MGTRPSRTGTRGAMAREIRAPEQVTDDLDAAWLVANAGFVAEIISKYTRYTRRQVLECVMRVVGHLCATGGER